MSNKIPTIKRAKWMGPGTKYVSTNLWGYRKATAELQKYRPEYGLWEVPSVEHWWGPDVNDLCVWGPRTKPPADPAKTLRRIR